MYKNVLNDTEKILNSMEVLPNIAKEIKELSNKLSGYRWNHDGTVINEHFIQTMELMRKLKYWTLDGGGINRDCIGLCIYTGTEWLAIRELLINEIKREYLNILYKSEYKRNIGEELDELNEWSQELFRLSETEENPPLWIIHK